MSTITSRDKSSRDKSNTRSSDKSNNRSSESSMKRGRDGRGTKKRYVTAAYVPLLHI